MERSFVEVWSLSFDDIGLTEGANRSGRVWFAFQLSFFRERSRFPCRSGDVPADVVQYLSEQLGIAAPDERDFEYGHVTARRHRAAILRHFGIRRATDRDPQALRDELAEMFQGSFGKIENQIELGYRKSRARGYFVPSDKIMERLVRGARHDAVENLLARIADSLPGETRGKLEASLADPKCATGFLSLKSDAGAATLESILAAATRLAFVNTLGLPFDAMANIDPALVQRLSRRVDGETAAEMRRHGDTRRLNVVENWNSANGFVFFGKGGEIASNRIVDQEISALALQLVQASMVYVNTRMVQSVLSDPNWQDRLSPEDYRGLTPLIYAHITPYGRHDIDLATRIDYERQAA